MKKIVTAVLTGFVALNIFVTSCHDPKKPGLEFMPEMYRSPDYETYSPSPLNADSMSAMLPVAGTVARNQFMLFNYKNTPEDYERAGTELKNPIAANEENLEEGKRLFNIYCIHCHGEHGDGKGLMNITSKGGGPFPVPSYFDDAHKELPDGKMFFSITYGKNLMGPHAPQVSQEERWKIILYINKLQDDGLAAAKAAAAPAPADSTKKKS
jgi:mono/diheme cytochrome c family protein